MSTQSHSVVMLRRNVKHLTRNPTSVFNAVLMPIIIMLMFVYMLGDAFNVGVSYVDYATPGLMLLAVCYGLGATATAVNSDIPHTSTTSRPRPARPGRTPTSSRSRPASSSATTPTTRPPSSPTRT